LKIENTFLKSTHNSRRDIMATSKKKPAKDSKEITSTESLQDDSQLETEQLTVSDSKLVLAPLAKYGVVAVAIASIVVVTAVMMNRELNDIENQVASLEAEIAEEMQFDQQPAEEIKVIEDNSATVAVVAEQAVSSPFDAPPVVELPVATAPAVEVPVVNSSVTTPVAAIAQPATQTNVGFKARIIEHHAYMAKQDQKHLNSFKANQAKQIEMLRKQLAQQQVRIDAIEERNQKSYDMRKANIKRMQDIREQSLNRI
jgi:hypothetical protein